MKKACRFAVILAVIIAAGTVFAEDVVKSESTPIIGVTAKVGTLGVGADLTLNLGPYFNLRGGYNGLVLNQTVDLDEAKIDGELNWQTIPILLDWHPAAGGFRISAGPVINNNKIILSATPGYTIKLGGKDYEVLSLDGEISFDQLSWYAGIGSGNAVGKDGRVHFSCDFGVMFHGAPQAEATGITGNTILQAMFKSDLNEELDEFEEDAKPFAFYPVISFGVSFGF